jgi:hypothetical protein
MNIHHNARLTPLGRERTTVTSRPVLKVAVGGASATSAYRKNGSHPIWLTVNTEKLPRLLANVVPIIPAPTQSAI